MDTFRFDADTASSLQPDGRVAVHLSADWNVDGRILNGGYVQAVIVRAAQQVAQAAGATSLTPVVVSTSFAAQAAAGDGSVEVEVLRSGSRVTTVAATLRQSAGAVASSLVTFSRGPAAASGAGDTVPVMPSVTPAERSFEVPTHLLPGPPGLAELIDYRFVPEDSRWLGGDFSAGPRIRCWLSFADGRPLDALAVTALMDIAPPVCFAVGNFGWAPTLQLQVGLFATPTTGPVLLDLVGSPYDGAVVAEDGLLWDGSGTLLARSRQVALAPRG